jgi:hypothetical protein
MSVWDVRCATAHRLWACSLELAAAVQATVVCSSETAATAEAAANRAYDHLDVATIV